MSSVNKAIILGYLGADPEVRYTPAGKAVCELRVATNEKWTKDGQPQERTEWHRLVAWEKTAELCGKYLKKGDQAFFEGKIQTRSWDDKAGNKRYTTEIVVGQVNFLGQRGGPKVAPKAEPKSEETKPLPKNEESKTLLDDFVNEAEDDIPF
jgi:single-strand DNA-binding protein